MADALPSMVPKGERAKIGHWIALAFQMVRIYHTHVDCGVERSFTAVCSVKSMSSASGGQARGMASEGLSKGSDSRAITETECFKNKALE